MRLADRWLVSSAEATARRAARRRRKDLERELAGYSTSAQRGDLEATFDRYSDGVTHEYRDILSQQSRVQEGRRFRASAGTDHRSHASAGSSWAAVALATSTSDVRCAGRSR